MMKLKRFFVTERQTEPWHAPGTRHRTRGMSSLVSVPDGVELVPTIRHSRLSQMKSYQVLATTSYLSPR